jgi:hypothetical protein
MRDGLEQRLAERLHAVGASMPSELDAPADLELRVARRVRRQRRRVRVGGIATVAALVAGVVAVAMVSDSPRRDGVNVAAGRRATADQIDSSVVMVDARGRFVTGLDAGGHQRETLVVADTGNVVDAQVTADHSKIWYLSTVGTPGADCGKVVRADITTGASRIMFSAIAFAVSPDGTHVALSGSGASPGGQCSATGRGARVAIVDLAHGGAASTVPVAVAPRSLRWSVDGAALAAEECSLSGCSISTYAAQPFAAIASRTDASGPMFGADGLYFVEHRVGGVLAVVHTDSRMHAPATLYARSAKSLAVVPTSAATFVFGAVAGGAPTLFSIGTRDSGRGVATPLRSWPYGTLVPVPPLG